jgi:hypothetical protein
MNAVAHRAFPAAALRIADAAQALALFGPAAALAALLTARLAGLRLANVA